MTPQRNLVSRIIGPMSWMMLGVFLALAAAPARARDILVFALFEHKAMLVVDGTRHMVRVGEATPEGVKLIATDTEAEQATVEDEGRREVLKLGAVHTGAQPAEAPNVILWAASNGFFFADGTVNGHSLRFLVDTGANTVAMNAATARRLGIDYQKGRAGMAKTASGFAPMYGVTLSAVKVGGIMLHNVEAGVIDGPQPDTPLLGMSFLNRLEMKRDGRKMELIQRY